MKKIILCLGLSWVSLVVCGQENFEGIIKYKMYEKNEKGFTQFITIHFKDNFVKTFIKGKHNINTSVLDLEKGLIYKMDDDLKVIIIDSLFDNSFMNIIKTFKSAKILIHSKLKSPYFIENFSSTQYIRDTTITTESKIRLKIANKMFFKIPSKYFLNTLLPSNGTNIILEAETEMQGFTKTTTFKIEAIEIEKSKISNSTFFLPDNYKKLNNKEYTNLILSISNSRFKQKQDSLKIIH